MHKPPPHQFHTKLIKLAIVIFLNQHSPTFKEHLFSSLKHKKKKVMMTLHRYLSYLIILISFVACCSSLQEDPLSSIVEDSPNINDDGGTTFKGFIKQTTDNMLRLRSSEKLGDTSSLKTVNVNDYGAEGDGHTDDTQVCIYMHQTQTNITYITFIYLFFQFFLFYLKDI